jgi:hypothetical protein
MCRLCYTWVYDTLEKYPLKRRMNIRDIAEEILNDLIRIQKDRYKPTRELVRNSDSYIYLEACYPYVRCLRRSICLRLFEDGSDSWVTSISWFNAVFLKLFVEIGDVHEHHVNMVVYKDLV